MKNKPNSENQKKTKDNEPKKKSGMESGLEALVLVPQLGLTIAIPILVGAYAGHWLDGKLGTGMIFTIILLCVGIAGGVASAYQLITMVTKKKRL